MKFVRDKRLGAIGPRFEASYKHPTTERRKTECWEGQLHDRRQISYTFRFEFLLEPWWKLLTWWLGWLVTRWSYYLTVQLMRWSLRMSSSRTLPIRRGSSWTVYSCHSRIPRCIRGWEFEFAHRAYQEFFLSLFTRDNSSDFRGAELPEAIKRLLIDLETEGICDA